MQKCSPFFTTEGTEKNREKRPVPAMKIPDDSPGSAGSQLGRGRGGADEAAPPFRALQEIFRREHAAGDVGANLVFALLRVS